MKNIFRFLAVPIFSLTFLGARYVKAEVQPELGGGVSEPRAAATRAEDEQLYKQKARQRLYPGGRDEEPLRVQIQMSQPTRKMGPATEAPEPTSTSADD